MEETKYEGKYIKVTEELIEGNVWERAYIKSGVQVFPITKDGKIILIEERRPHEKNPIRLKFVTGQMDYDHEDPIMTANREMQEEIGMIAEDLTILMHRESSGTLNNHFYQIIATKLSISKIPNPDGEDSIVSIKEFTIDEVLSFYENGKLSWGLDSIAIFRIKNLLSQNKISY